MSTTNKEETSWRPLIGQNLTGCLTADFVQSQSIGAKCQEQCQNPYTRWQLNVLSKGVCVCVKVCVCYGVCVCVLGVCVC